MRLGVTGAGSSGKHVPHVLLRVCLRCRTKLQAIMSDEATTVALFVSIGLKENAARDLAKNKKKSKALVDVIHEVCHHQKVRHGNHLIF